ncbi:hypothetical protein SB766_28275, partial [Pseudomonas sp. SIMBA_077]
MFALSPITMLSELPLSVARHPTATLPIPVAEAFGPIAVADPCEVAVLPATAPLPTAVLPFCALAVFPTAVDAEP